MSERSQYFIRHLLELNDRDRCAIACLKRSLSHALGTYPRAYPYVERFVGADRHAHDPQRLAFYLTAGLFAMNPRHQDGQTLASAYGRVAQARKSASLEVRFIAALEAEPEALPTLLRQIVSLFDAEKQGLDYALLLDDLITWLNPFTAGQRDAILQRWARDFYRNYQVKPDPESLSGEEAAHP